MDQARRVWLLHPNAHVQADRVALTAGCELAVVRDNGPIAVGGLHGQFIVFGEPDAGKPDI